MIAQSLHSRTSSSRLGRRLILATSLVAAGLALPALAETGVITTGATDAQANSDATVSAQTALYGRLGADTGVRHSVVHVFKIPTSVLNDPSQQFSAATYGIKLGQGSTMTVNGDLYGVGYGSDPNVVAADFYEGTLDPNNALIHDNFLTPSTPAYANVSTSNTSLVNYLNTALNGARAQSLTDAYIFLRLSLDAYVWSGIYIVGMSDAAAPYPATLSYQTVSVPSWSTVPLGGGGYVVGIVSDPSGNDIYCRTDVGGAFRWDAAGSQWKCITDNLVPPATRGSDGLNGIPSIAVDPSNSSNVYVVAGKYSYSGNRGVYASSDKGQTWTKIQSNMVTEGNGAFRTCGERLAVDPNNSNVLWCGTTQEGLQKGVNSGGTWTWTQIPSTSVPFGAVASGGKAGVTFVACDKNGGNTIVYAGVYDSVGTTGGVYSSTDGGATWAKVGGAVIGTPKRAAIAGNGTLYVTAGSAGLAKMDRGGSLSIVSPATGVNFHGVATALSDATGNTVFVAESSANGGPYGKMWRSTTGGATWSAVQTTNFNGGNYTRKEPDNTPTLTGNWFCSTASLFVNPNNANDLWVGDFFGVARTQDAQNLGTSTGSTWNMLQKGQEEVVVLSMRSAPSGSKLVVGVADVNGFRYNDTSFRPYGTYGNSLGALGGGSTCGLDFCESNTNVWARTWNNGPANGGSGAYSKDGGASWLKFGQVAGKMITNNAAGGVETFDVGDYLATQKAKGNNTVTLALCANNSSAPQYSNQSITFDSGEAANSANWPTLIVNGTALPASALLADTFVANGAPTTNYGAAATLSTSYKYDNAPDTRRIYLKFDLSSVSSISSATLQLNRVASSNTLQTYVGVYACTNTSWVEGDGGTDNLPANELIWNNRPTTLASSGDPVGDPRYYDGGTSLHGGRVAISATSQVKMVWLPEHPTPGTSTAPRYSEDGGISWTASTGAPGSMMKNRFEPSTFITQLASDRVNGNFYMGAFGGASHAIYRSTDGGKTFASVGSVPANAWNVYRVQLVAAPAANDLWLCDDGVDTVGAGGIWRSTDGGATWAKKAGGVMAEVRQISFGKAQSGSGYTVFANGFKSGVKGVYRSDDYGVTWNPVAALPSIADIEAIAGDRQNYGRVFIGTHGRGIFQGQ